MNEEISSFNNGLLAGAMILASFNLLVLVLFWLRGRRRDDGRQSTQEILARGRDVLLLLVLFAPAVSFGQPMPQELYRGGLGTPISDSHLLTVSHLGWDRADANVSRDGRTDLMVVGFAPGTFLEWATLSLEPPVVGEEVLVAVRRSAAVLSYDVAVSQFVGGGRLFATEPLLRPGDSGGGVFDSGGRLVGVNYAIDSKGVSYHVNVADRYDWIMGQVTAVPEPSVMALLAGAVVVGLIFRVSRRGRR